MTLGGLTRVWPRVPGVQARRWASTRSAARLTAGAAFWCLACGHRWAIPNGPHVATHAEAVTTAKALVAPGGRIYLLDIETAKWSQISSWPQPPMSRMQVRTSERRLPPVLGARSVRKLDPPPWLYAARW